MELNFVVNIAVEMGRVVYAKAQIQKSFSHIIFNHAKRVKIS
jgi:hypothetical protein